MAKVKKEIFLGLNIGSDTVGYAVMDSQYNLERFKGSDAWGVSVFEKGSLSGERKSYRSLRRRTNRKKQRVRLLQEIFANEIARVDEGFFERLSKSYLWRDEADSPYILFNDVDYTDKQYMENYPTIHHLICDLMHSKEPHDVRLVYLACSWLLSNRGHFITNLSLDRIKEITDIKESYQKLTDYFTANDYSVPWGNIDLQEIGNILKKEVGVKEKNQLLLNAFFPGGKVDKAISDTFPFRQDLIIKLLAGGKCKLSDLYGKEEYKEIGSISLNMDDEAFVLACAAIGEDGKLIEALRGIYDWSILANILAGSDGTISGAKVSVYEQHKKDLETLKYFVKKYAPEKYNEVFKTARADNYVAYSGHAEEKIAAQIKKKTNVEDFSNYVLKIIENILPDPEDQDAYNDMHSRLSAGVFLPKQRSVNNRVIPHQLYEIELKQLLDNASGYLPFLLENKDGLSEAEKIMEIFRFKIPYYVGPLNPNSEYAWISRKAGKITPWNFNEIVNQDESEAAFIKNLIGQCTYLPDEDVLPGASLCYQAFAVLNEINNLKINGKKIPVAAKQGIFNELFLKRKVVKIEHIENYLLTNGYWENDQNTVLGGVDVKIKTSLSSYYAFRKYLKSGELSEKDVEHIIERSSYAEDKSRLEKWLQKEFPAMDEADIRYICGIRIDGRGKLSKRFLTGFEGVNKDTGEVTTILQTMWDTNDSLSTLLSDKYTFGDEIEEYRSEYYRGNKITLDERMDQLYVSNTARRSIYRAFAIIKDVEKAFGRPAKIFIGTNSMVDSNTGRTVKRKDQILSCYAMCKKYKFSVCPKEDLEQLKQQLESFGDKAEDKLRSDRVFLYFMQFGKCAYSGRHIDLRKLITGSAEYNIDHIYPRAYVYDENVANNKVLVCSGINRDKDTGYPIDPGIQKEMRDTWSGWYSVSAISKEKYVRLTRVTSFSDEEKYSFIDRQLTETSKAAKNIITLLKEQYAGTDMSIIGVKRGVVSEFRKEFDLPKSRLYNDLYRASDAYLTTVIGNVYSMKFTRRWFDVRSRYSIKIRSLFTFPVKCGNMTVWDGSENLTKVRKTALKMSAKVIRYPVYKRGQLFDLNPVKKRQGLIPRKSGLPTEKYGGYNSAKSMGFIPIRYVAGKKSEVIILGVEIMHGERFMKDEHFALQYCFDKLEKILGYKVDDVSFPFGLKVWKSGTTFSFDDFRMYLSGTNGKQLSFTPVMQFSSDPCWIRYLKWVEKFIDKNKGNTSVKYDPAYDKVSVAENLQLYKLYIDKFQNSIYRKHPNPVTEILVNGEEKFVKLNILEQCRIIFAVQSLFGRVNTGVNLTAIGGRKNSGSTSNLSSTISNWKKKYSDVRVIAQSPSGLWEKSSPNLFSILEEE